MDVKNEEQVSDGGLISLVSQLSKAFHRRATEERLGMRLKAYMTLCYLRDHPGVTQQELENGLLLDANTVVLILNELEAAQFSVRRRDPQDRRRHIVEMTAAGRRALERADRGRATYEDELLRPLTPDERRTLRRYLERVLEGMLQETRAQDTNLAGR